ncbi:MAG: hypothetical protein EBS15_01255 [Actinobacteria bacterium]|jgi:hypothetical protein|nr:hypothetical protein [Actinomycetota bacterium]
MTIQSEVRAPLATALAGVTASVYQSPPETIIAPACVIVSDSPYMESTLINGAVTKVKINFIISAVVAYNNNAGALDGLEQLCIQILGAMPAGYVVGVVERPTIMNVGTGSFLMSDISVSTYYTQENN